jgi:hypothetical protein
VLRQPYGVDEKAMANAVLIEDEGRGTLQRQQLEHGQHRRANMVKVGLRAFPSMATKSIPTEK